MEVSAWSSWSTVSCGTIIGARVMWWRCANPPMFVGSLSTTLRRSPPVRAVELLGFDYNLCGSSGVRHSASADSMLKMRSKDGTTLLVPPSKKFLLWPTLGHIPPPTANPSRRCTPSRPRNCWQGGGEGILSSSQGGRGGIKGGGACAERGACSDKGVGEGQASEPGLGCSGVKAGGGEARKGWLGGHRTCTPGLPHGH